MEIFLIRHGESVHNSRGKVQGQLGSELTERGREQAKSITENLDPESFDAVYSSKLKRVRQTVEIALKDEDIDVTFDERLNERDVGELEGEDNTIWQELDAEDSQEWSPEGGESLNHHKERMADFVENLDDSNDKVLVFTHGGSVAALIFWIISCESRQAWRISMDNCALATVRQDELGRWVVGKVNDQII